MGMANVVGAGFEPDEPTIGFVPAIAHRGQFYPVEAAVRCDGLPRLMVKAGTPDHVQRGDTAVGKVSLILGQLRIMKTARHPKQLRTGTDVVIVVRIGII